MYGQGNSGPNLSFLFFTFFREVKSRIKLPRDLEDAKDLGRVLSSYKDDYFTQVLLGFVVTYILYPL